MSTKKVSTTEKVLVTRVPLETLAKIDQLAEATGQTRSCVTVMLIENALLTIRINSNETKKAVTRSATAKKAAITKKAAKKVK